MDNHSQFTQFVNRHKSTVYSVCYMFAKDRADADDLFQEVLVNLWKGFATYRGESAERTWVYRISLNTCISFDRKKHRHHSATTDIDLDVFSEDTPLGAQSALLHKRIQRLDVFDRAIVLLWLEDMPYDEIAAIVGLSTKALGVRLVRIREKLKKMND